MSEKRTAASAPTSTSTTTISTHTTSAATTVAGHFGKARIDLLLGFSKYCDKIASLLQLSIEAVIESRNLSRVVVKHYLFSIYKTRTVLATR